MAESLSQAPFGTVKVAQRSDFLINAAMGRIPGVRALYRFGRGTVTTTPNAIWTEGGAYPFLGSEQPLTVSSADAGDTAQITVHDLLDASYHEIPDVTVTLNGQNPVPIGNALRCSRAVVTGGSITGPVFVGTGALTGGKPATVLARIEAADNQTQQAIFTVPAGKTAVIYEAEAFVDSTKVTIIDEVALNGNGVPRSFGQVILGGSQSTHVLNFAAGRVVPEKTDFYVTGAVTATTGIASVFIDYYLVDN